MMKCQWSRNVLLLKQVMALKEKSMELTIIFFSIGFTNENTKFVIKHLHDIPATASGPVVSAYPVPLGYPLKSQDSELQVATLLFPSYPLCASFTPFYLGHPLLLHCPSFLSLHPSSKVMAQGGTDRSWLSSFMHGDSNNNNKIDGAPTRTWNRNSVYFQQLLFEQLWIYRFRIAHPQKRERSRK